MQLFRSITNKFVTSDQAWFLSTIQKLNSSPWNGGLKEPIEPRKQTNKSDGVNLFCHSQNCPSYFLETVEAVTVECRNVPARIFNKCPAGKAKKLRH